MFSLLVRPFRIGPHGEVDVLAEATDGKASKMQPVAIATGARRATPVLENLAMERVELIVAPFVLVAQSQP
jgi:hypothetical protein